MNETVIPAFNIPYLPMIQPVIQAVKEENIIAMIQIAMIDWEKFGAHSIKMMAHEYQKYADQTYTLLHLDHIPVINEDMHEIDYYSVIEEALYEGFQSVMIDGSRLDLQNNIEATRKVAVLAHRHGVPCEAELGAVMGHESGPILPYEEIFTTKKGFTDIDETYQFVKRSGCDWLSVAVGNIHGAIAESTRNQKKPQARLDIDHIRNLYSAAGIPLVLHGGSGIEANYIRKGIKAGIAKINIGTEIRQAYEHSLNKTPKDIDAAQAAVFERVRDIVNNTLGIRNSRAKLCALTTQR